MLPLMMTAREILKILYKDGWLKISQKGSHLQLIHPIKKGKVTIPIHSGDMPKGIVNSILKQAGLKQLYKYTMKKIQLIIERGPDKKFWGRILIEDNLIVDSAETVGELDLKMKALLNQFHDINI